MKKILFFCVLFLLSTSAFANDKLVVLLDWFANPSHAPLFVAQQEGFFKEQQLDVELIGPADPTDPPKLVAANKADIAITYEPRFLEQIDQGLPLFHLGTLINKPLTCLVVLKEGPIKTIHDLKGKRVGFSGGSMTSVTLQTMLGHVGLKNSDVEQINVHYDLTQALLSRKVDAVTGVMRNFEVLQMELAGHPARVFLPENYGMPTYSELIFVANEAHRGDPRFTRFLQAVAKGEAYLKKHPEECWKKFATMHPELNDELNHRAWFATVPYFTDHPEQFDAKAWREYAKFLQNNELIKRGSL